jgi:hypothetical protein
METRVYQLSEPAEKALRALKKLCGRRKFKVCVACIWRDMMTTYDERTLYSALGNLQSLGLVNLSSDGLLVLLTERGLRYPVELKAARSVCSWVEMSEPREPTSSFSRN